MALDMLRLAGFDSKEKLIPQAHDPETWTQLEKQMRDRCGKELIAALQKAKPLQAADALYRVLSPWEFELQIDLDKEPSRPWHRDQRKKFFDWLQARYDAEAANLAKSPNPTDQAASVFFSEASSALRLK